MSSLGSHSLPSIAFCFSGSCLNFFTAYLTLLCLLGSTSQHVWRTEVILQLPLPNISVSVPIHLSRRLNGLDHGGFFLVTPHCSLLTETKYRRGKRVGSVCLATALHPCAPRSEPYSSLYYESEYLRRRKMHSSVVLVGSWRNTSNAALWPCAPGQSSIATCPGQYRVASLFTAAESFPARYQVWRACNVSGVIGRFLLSNTHYLSQTGRVWWILTENLQGWWTLLCDLLLFFHC